MVIWNTILPLAVLYTLYRQGLIATNITVLYSLINSLPIAKASTDISTNIVFRHWLHCLRLGHWTSCVLLLSTQSLEKIPQSDKCVRMYLVKGRSRESLHIYDAKSTLLPFCQPHRYKPALMQQRRPTCLHSSVREPYRNPFNAKSMAETLRICKDSEAVNLFLTGLYLNLA